MQALPTIDHVATVAESKLFRIEAVDLTFSNGEKRVFERIRGHKKRGSVMIVPMLDENTVLLAKEYVVGLERYEIGLPKGLRDPGESFEQAAHRELQEECGYAAKRYTTLKAMSAAPGHIAGLMQIILAQDLYPQTLPGDEPEPIDVMPWCMDEISDLFAREDCTEARSIAALFMAREFLRSRSD